MMLDLVLELCFLDKSGPCGYADFQETTAIIIMDKAPRADGRSHHLLRLESWMFVSRDSGR